MAKENNIDWFLKNASYLKIYAIERELSIYEGGLKKFVDGKINLSTGHEKKLVKWVTSFRQGIVLTGIR